MFTKLMLIALVGVVSAEEALTTSVVNAGAQAYCGEGTNANIPNPSTGSDTHVVTIQHGKCKLVLKAEHTNAVDESKGKHFDLVTSSVSVPDSFNHSEHQGYFTIKYEDDKTPNESSEQCDLDVQTTVDYRPNISPTTNEFTVEVDITYAAGAVKQEYETGYQFQQWYNYALNSTYNDWRLLNGTDTNYNANSDSWRYFITGTQMFNSGAHTTTAVVFDWDTTDQACNGPVTAASGCPASCTTSAGNPTSCPTSVTCEHVATGKIMATHNFTDHTKHMCWVDREISGYATNNEACKCMCLA